MFWSLAMVDFSLAVVHHLVVFSLLAIVVAELSLVRRGIDMDTIAAVARIDLAYGALAAVALAAGLWAELALFALLPVCAVAMARGYGQFT